MLLPMQAGIADSSMASTLPRCWGAGAHTSGLSCSTTVPCGIACLATSPLPACCVMPSASMLLTRNSASTSRPPAFCCAMLISPTFRPPAVGSRAVAGSSTYVMCNGFADFADGPQYSAHSVRHVLRPLRPAVFDQSPIMQSLPLSWLPSDDAKCAAPLRLADRAASHLSCPDD